MNSQVESQHSQFDDPWLNRDWKLQLRESYSSVSDLLRGGLLSAHQAERLGSLDDRFKTRVTRYYSSLFDSAETCPIRRQALPDLEEQDPDLPARAVELSRELYGREAPWHADAIGDVKNLAAPRLTHRYGNRAILHLSSMCALYCRFCFRKEHLSESEKALYGGPLDQAFDYLEKTPQIRELILTGGDPLSLSDEALAEVLDRADRIPHLRVVRIHSRMAVTLPARLAQGLAQVLGARRRFRVALVSHFNHPRELSETAKQALGSVARAGVSLFNQSVLMRGVNDSVEILAELFQSLYEAGVMPFYLHHPDWTPGTFGFRLSIERGQELVRQLRGRVPGPALPHYVVEIPGGQGKVSLMESQVRRLESFSGGGIEGVLYELRSPQVRPEVKTQDRHLYLDLCSGRPLVDA